MPKFLLLEHYRGGPEPVRPYPFLDQWEPAAVDAHTAFLAHVTDTLDRRGRAGPVRAGRADR